MLLRERKVVLRFYILCSTCETNYTLRIGVGHESEQHHTIQCRECHEDMAVTLHVDMEEVSTRFECVINCKEGMREGVIYNLHPEYVFKEEERNVDLSFPWLIGGAKVAKIQSDEAEKQGIDLTNIDMLEIIKKMTSTENLWKTLKKAWSLEQNGRQDLSLKHLLEYKDYRFQGPQELNYAIFHFCERVGGKFGFEVFESGVNFIETVSHSNKDEYQRFLHFYNDNIKKDNFENYLDICSEFFRDFSEYNQVLSSVHYGLDICENTISGSAAFKKTKMFYGNAFEIYTSSLTILACLNNIANGRKFDEFKSMDLRLVGSKVYFRSGGTGEEKVISYAEYLSKCIEIFISITALIKMELILSFKN